MSRHARREGLAPDWPERLRLRPRGDVTVIVSTVVPATPSQWQPDNGMVHEPSIPPLEQIAANPHITEETRAKAVGLAASQISALLLGHLADGRHVAAEVQVLENAVVGGTILCASPYAQRAAHAWSLCAKARLFDRREYTTTEKAANAREGNGVALTELAHGEALALGRVGTKSVAARLEIEGLKVVRFAVLAQGDHLTTTAEAFSWAQRNLLPRERRR